MIYISHRGNIYGEAPIFENHPDHIKLSLKLGYEVEVDVWYNEEQFWLGHNEPLYKVEPEFLENENLWIHAKNHMALMLCLKYGFHVFWHQEDDCTITSKGYVWAYPGKDIEGSIAVMPEINNDSMHNRVGMCSDIVGEYKNNMELYIDEKIS